MSLFIDCDVRRAHGKRRRRREVEVQVRNTHSAIADCEKVSLALSCTELSCIGRDVDWSGVASGRRAADTIVLDSFPSCSPQPIEAEMIDHHTLKRYC